jgi:hypothetical protein
MWNSEWWIGQINFYSGTETLVKLGEPDEFIQLETARVELFEIAFDEQLIGCELNIDEDDYFIGLTWLKWKLSL